MAAANGEYRPNGVNIFIPLPLEVIQRLQERKESIEACKNDYMKVVLHSGRAPSYGVLYEHNKLAALFLQYVIFQDYVPPATQSVISQCLELTTASSGSLDYFGIHKSQVLLEVNGMTLVLLTFQQAATRGSQLFLPVPLLALRELSKREVCPNGATCRNILNGSCPLWHSKQDIAHAGAIVQERIALPPCQSTRELLWRATRGQQQQDDTTTPCLWTSLSSASGASIQLQEEHDGMYIVLVGSRLAVNKGMELVMDLVSKYQKDDTTTTTTTTVVVKTIQHVSPHKAQLLHGTNGDTIKEIEHASRTNIWLEFMEGNVQCLHIRGRPEAVEYGIQLILGWWHAQGESAQDVDIVSSTTSATSGITGEEVPPPASSRDVALVPTTTTSLTVANSTNDENKTSNVIRNHSNKDEQNWPALGLTKLKLSSPNSPRIKTKPLSAAVPSWNTNTRANPPAKMDDTKEWPLLQSETNDSSSNKLVVSSSNAMLPYAKKAAMPPKPVTSLVKATTKKTSKKQAPPTVATVNYKHPCIHGSRCQFIKSGSDQCKFFHSSVEIEEAAARYTNHSMYLSPVVVGWVIGDKGSRLKQLEEKSGTNMYIDQDSMGPKENRILYISGEPECVEKGAKLVKKLLPKKFDVDASKGGASSNAKATNGASASKKAAVVTKKEPTVAPKPKKAIVVAKKEPTPAPSTNHARATTAAAKKANPNKKVEHIMYISPAVVGWIIGKDGKILKEKIQKRGAKMEIDSESMRLNESKIVYITGKQKSVDAAIELVMEQLPNGYKPEVGPGVPGVDSASAKDSSKPAPTVNTVTPDFQDDPMDKVSNLRAPSKVASTNPTASVRSLVPNALDYQQEAEELISPPRPIRQLHHQDESIGFVSSSTSLSSVSDIIPSNVVTTSGHVSPPFMNGTSGDDMGGGYGTNNAILAGGILPRVAQPVSTVSSLASWEKVIAPSTTTVSTAPTVTSDSISSNDSLLGFLVEQEACLKGSAKNFLEWLATEDICSLNDLAEAVADEEYLRDVLQQGNGSIGVKGFKRAAFTKAVLVASQSMNGGNSATSSTYKGGAF